MEIDFVILWVDGADPKWQEELALYSPKGAGDKSKVRFRDWDNLQYIFRAFEQFTPWVNKIHFVTWGHLPQWLNTNHPKLNIVNHQDYIDKKNLPLFNANPLEINFHNISGLTEQFVFFNDDFFLTSPIKPTRFFNNNLPCDAFISNTLSSSAGVGHFVLNNLEVLNRHFSKRQTFKENIFKVFSSNYSFSDNIRNLALLPWPRFTGFVDPHQPQPFLKSTFKEVWNKEQEILEQTSASKFRACTDINQYLFRYWQLAQGKFVPVSMKDTKYVTLDINQLKSGEIKEMIISKENSMLCLNDGESIKTEEDFEEAKLIIKKALDEILPLKSKFEL